MAKKQKQEKNFIWISLLIIISVATLVLGIVQIKNTIYSPFSMKNIIPTQESLVSDLKITDLDQDGLSDFDEQFVHQTSMYLADSDSDGYTDGEEIAAQSDPLNPESNPLNKIIGEHALEQEIIGQTEEGTENNSGLGQNNVSIQEIRRLLVEKGGMSQEIVDKLDDETLQELYNETKQTTGIDLENLGIPESFLEQFSQLDIGQLRQLLIDQGADEEILNQISDDDLKDLFLQSLQQ